MEMYFGSREWGRNILFGARPKHVEQITMQFVLFRRSLVADYPFFPNELCVWNEAKRNCLGLSLSSTYDPQFWAIEKVRGG